MKERGLHMNDVFVWPVVHVGYADGCWLFFAEAFVGCLVLYLVFWDSWRMQRKHSGRRRMAMEALYMPISCIKALLDDVEDMTRAVLVIGFWGPPFSVTMHIDAMVSACNAATNLAEMFDPSEVVFLSGDSMASLSVSMREVQILIELIQSAAGAFYLASKIDRHDEMKRALRSLRRVPDFCRHIGQKLHPFLDACKNEFGEVRV
jgi:hypothetical protein